MKALIFVKRHLSTILTVASCTGVAVTGYLAAKGGAKAQKKLITEDFKRNFNAGEETHEPIPIKDKIEITWKDYTPAIVAGSLTVGTIIFCEARHIKTEKNLIAAAMMGQTLLQRYENQVRQRTDYEMASEVRKDVIGELTCCLGDDIHQSYSGDEARMQCYDPYSKTFYRASQTELLLAEIELNKCLMNGGAVRLSDYLERFTNDICTRYQDPETIGWVIDDDYTWNSSFYGYHCGLMPSVENVDGTWCVVTYFSHDPITPEDGFCYELG